MFWDGWGTYIKGVIVYIVHVQIGCTFVAALLETNVFSCVPHIFFDGTTIAVRKILISSAIVLVGFLTFFGTHGKNTYGQQSAPCCCRTFALQEISSTNMKHGARQNN